MCDLSEMASVATYEDANLILRLFELRREEQMRRARAWFLNSFNATTVEEYQALCPPGSDPDAYFRMLVTYWDMAASFVTSGVLHQDLFLESGNELLFVWEKMKFLVPAWRGFMGNPKFLSSLEAVAQAAVQRMNRADPNAHATWLANMAKRSSGTRSS
jgi:hypothetical protein